MPTIFVDTNVLIYVRDRKDQAKRTKARDWLDALAAREAGCLNLQVLNEFTRWVLAREPARKLADIRAEVDALRAWGADPVSPDEIDVAWEVRRRLGFGWFDCLLLAAALARGCSHFLTEDLTDGAALGDLRIVNPFSTDVDSILR
jgi:predicted nucleic acid-binding protein